MGLYGLKKQKEKKGINVLNSLINEKKDINIWNKFIGG